MTLVADAFDLLTLISPATQLHSLLPHDSGGASFRDLALKSAARIPTAAIVFGSSTAGGAYSPGMSDYIIMVKVCLISWTVYARQTDGRDAEPSAGVPRWSPAG